MTQAALELRILTGLHAMAAAPWTDANTPLSLGHGPDNDVILRDAPFERAELRQHADEFELLIDDQVLTITQGQPVQGDPLTWIIQSNDAAWPTQWHNATRLHLKSMQSETAEALPLSTLTLTSDNTPLPDARHPLETDDLQEVMMDSPLVESPVSTSRAWPRYAAWSLFLLCTGATLLYLHALKTEQGTAVQAQINPAPITSAAQDVTVETLEQLLKDAGWSEQVGVKAGSQGGFRLLGVVNSMDDVEQVVHLLSSQTRRIEPHVLTQLEFEQRVNGLQTELPEGIRVFADTGGRILLQVNQAQRAQIKPTRDLLLAEIPEARDVEVVTAGKRVPAYTSAAGGWSLPPIASVHSGENAYVMLTNGHKVLPGGSLAKLTLSSIEDGTLVLQAPNGQLLRVNR